MVDLVFHQRNLGAGIKNYIFYGRWGRHKRRTVAPVVTHVLGRVYGNDAFTLACSRNIDAEKPGVRVVAAEEGSMKHPRDVHVVNKQSPPGQQARVFISLHSLADVLLGHCASPVLQSQQV